MGLPVVAQYGGVAVEALATPEEARAARDLGMFSAALKGAMKDQHLERLTDEQRAIVELWNARFSAGYRRLKTDTTLRGRPWGDPGMAAPAPHSPIAAEDFLALVEEFERRTGRPAAGKAETGAGVAGSGRGRRKGQRTAQEQRPPGSMPPGEFADYERDLADRYKDTTIAYHLSRLAATLGSPWHGRMRALDLDFLRELIERLFREAECWKMTGEIAVGLVFVESSRRGGPRFTDAERNEICDEIIDGLTWLAAEHPGGDLSWVFDLQFVRIDVADGTDTPANCASLSSLEAGWRDPAMAQVVYNGTTYTSDWAAVGRYREDMRRANRAAHAVAVFVTPYANCWHAYASSGRFVLAKRNDWGGWGRGTLDTITAHEVSHLFGSADEYTGSGTPCSTCESVHGCDRIPNGNCAACSRPHQACVMDQNTRRICAYTRGQIGWSHLFAELTTADELWASTDDDVWLDIGDRSFVLDTPGHDDRERNNREGHAIWAPGIGRQDVKRVMIRKSPDGFAGGWKLRGVRAWSEGQVICDEPAVNRWLEDDHRTWVGCVSDGDLVSSLVVRITTADVMWAGTDDDVSITLAGRTWDLDVPWRDDFERGSTGEFVLDPGTGLHVSDIHSVTVRKSPDGFAGGWKLRGVEVIANGGSIFNDQSINKWLEDRDRMWSAAF